MPRNNDYLQSLSHLAMGTRLKRAGIAMQAETQKWLRDNDCEIASAHLPVISALDRMGHASIGELARRLGIAQPGVSRMVDQLVAAGWVSSDPDLEDRRIRAVELTDKGRAFADEASRTLWPVIERAVARLCSGLSGSFLDQVTELEDRLAEGALQGHLLEAQADREQPA